ncbi:MAG: PxKF domain-containing protein [Acidimicrobiales bacterium]|nr:PxKF domain-containing protein [Acidimicrobiales bacterium]
MITRRVLRRTMAALGAAALAVVALPASTATAAGSGTVEVSVAEAPGSYATGFCASGDPVLFSFACSDGSPAIVDFLPTSGSATLALPAGTYRAALADVGGGSLGAIGPVTVPDGGTVACTFSLAGAPACGGGSGPGSGTLELVVGEPSGSYAAGVCADPGVPVAFSSVCSDGGSAQFAFLAGGASTSLLLPSGTYHGTLLDLGSGTLGPVGPVVVADGQTVTCVVTLSAAPACTADDGDGVDEPAGVDGNGDGIADADQASVATFVPAVGSDLVTIAAPDGASLRAVTTAVTASPPPPPAATLPIGVLGFTVDLAPGESAVDVDVILPPGTAPTSYAKLVGGTWVDLGAAATIAGDVVTLHLVDGDAFDLDGAVDGSIVDPGFPLVGYRGGPLTAPPSATAPSRPNAGRAIPVSWELTDAEGAPVGSADAVLAIDAVGGPCGGPAATVPADGSGPRATRTGEWSFTWKTDRSWAGECWALVVRFADGTSRSLPVAFR